MCSCRASSHSREVQDEQHLMPVHTERFTVPPWRIPPANEPCRGSMPCDFASSRTDAPFHRKRSRFTPKRCTVHLQAITVNAEPMNGSFVSDHGSRGTDERIICRASRFTRNRCTGHLQLISVPCTGSLDPAVHKWFSVRWPAVPEPWCRGDLPPATRAGTKGTLVPPAGSRGLFSSACYARDRAHFSYGGFTNYGGFTRA
jgi:hypothetical protein